MTVLAERNVPWMLHPLHAVLVAGTIPLFLGALISDIAYACTYQIQWQNFSSWLIVGGLVFAAAALVFAVFELVRADRREPRLWLYFLLLLIGWVVGFFNALIHAKDAWASMPAGLVLSAIVLLLVCVATGIGHSNPHRGVLS